MAQVDDPALLPPTSYPIHVTQATSDEVEVERHDLQDDGPDLLDILALISAHRRLLLLAPVLAAALALGLTYLVKPTYTAKTVFLPPQQQQGMAGAALSSLSSLSALTGLAGGAGIKTPGDQYVSLLQSANVGNRIIDRFNLMQVYKVKYRFEAQKELEEDVHIELGKRDGLITLEASAKDPVMAAGIANQYVDELRRLSSQLVLTEAQQRRAFFENQLKQTHAKMLEAQQVLQDSGFNPGALKAEPKAAADAYARIQAQVTAAEVRVQTLRGSLADAAPQLQQQLAQLTALREQLHKFEGTVSTADNADYVSHYREFKYQEALYELFAKQFESARIDESREGGLVQVVDVATTPEHKSKPKRAFIAAATGLFVLLLCVLGLLMRRFWEQAQADPRKTGKVARLRSTWSRRSA